MNQSKMKLIIFSITLILVFLLACIFATPAHAYPTEEQQQILAEIEQYQIKLDELSNDYNEALKTYLIEQRINDSVISDDNFTKIADEVFDKYRNPAAHAGNTMVHEDARACREKSKKVLKRFMSAVG